MHDAAGAAILEVSRVEVHSYTPAHDNEAELQSLLNCMSGSKTDWSILRTMVTKMEGAGCTLEMYCFIARRIWHTSHT